MPGATPGRSLEPDPHRGSAPFMGWATVTPAAMSERCPNRTPPAALVWFMTAISLAITARGGEAADRGAVVARDRSHRSGESPFHVVATDTGFVARSTLRPGMRHIVFENRGRQVHEAMFAKLPNGMDAAGYAAAVRAGHLFPDGALDYSGPGLTSPGESTELWLELDPGRYVLICFNGDHAESTPVHALTVEGTPVNDTPPKEDIVVRLADYHFEVVGQLRAGVQVLRFETTGPAMHEADLFRLLPGRTLDDLKRWRKAGKGAAPAIALGGVLDSHDIGRVTWMRKTFSPGVFALHCEMPMNAAASGGASDLTHADLGMALEISVPK